MSESSLPSQEELNIAGENARKSRLHELPVSLTEADMALVIDTVINNIVVNDLELSKAIPDAIVALIDSDCLYSFDENLVKFVDGSGFRDRSFELNHISKMLDILENQASYQDIYNFYYAKRGHEKYGSFDNFVSSLRMQINSVRERIREQ